MLPLSGTDEDGCHPTQAFVLPSIKSVVFFTYMILKLPHLSLDLPRYLRPQPKNEQAAVADIPHLSDLC